MDYSDNRVHQALELAQAGMIDEARGELVALIREDEDNVAAWAALAQIADVPRDAAYCLKQILRIQPDNDWARTHLQRLSQQETPTDQASQIDEEPQQQSQTSSPTRVSGKLILGAAGVLAIICLLGVLLVFWRGSLLSMFSSATGEPGLPTAMSPSRAPTSSPASTQPTDQETRLPGEASSEPGVTATSPATVGVAPTATQADQTLTATTAPSPTPSPTETQVLTPTDYPTATDPPEPGDVPPGEPPPAAGPCDCNSDEDMDCRDFDTQAQAQACYDYCIQETDRDIFFLDSEDGDLNELACENLP